MKIPKIVWFGVAAAALGYVVYRVVKGAERFDLPPADSPPAVSPGLLVELDDRGYWNVIDVERTFVLARITRSSAPHLRFEIDGEFYIVYVDGLQHRRWPRGTYIGKPPRVPQ